MVSVTDGQMSMARRRNDCDKNSSRPRKFCPNATLCTKNVKIIPSQNESEPLQTAAGEYPPQQWYGVILKLITI